MDTEGILRALENISSTPRNHLFIQSLNGVLINKKKVDDEVYNLCSLLESKISFSSEDTILQNDCIYLITIPLITNFGEKSFNDHLGNLETTQTLLIDLKYEGNMLSVFKIQ
ncbi:hypothetical protein N9450_04415 [Gammaproteobacteria bacterium]|nr:hypothetical protein [SAR86 cluster bacterium]MDB3994959.1 hypothetical protein [Gammaproteobacteria bacterium]|tara:strand:- start:811 stop:1146 length:336 start_codon:yes stop_codon:yes gene_type:complete